MASSLIDRLDRTIVEEAFAVPRHIGFPLMKDWHHSSTMLAFRICLRLLNLEIKSLALAEVERACFSMITLVIYMLRFGKLFLKWINQNDPTLQDFN